MNKIFKFGLAVFAMLLVSAVCFAQMRAYRMDPEEEAAMEARWQAFRDSLETAIDPKDKRCEGVWFFENDATKGFYIKEKKAYHIEDGMLFAYDEYDEMQIINNDQICGVDNISRIIKSVNGDKMVIEEYDNERILLGKSTLKKLSKLPPKASKHYRDYWYEKRYGNK